mgnify:CR=1 FL=1
MSWLEKLLPPKIQRTSGPKKTVPEGLWTKCPSCDAVLYSTDLEKNTQVCPKCGHHQRIRVDTGRGEHRDELHLLKRKWPRSLGAKIVEPVPD